MRGSRISANPPCTERWRSVTSRAIRRIVSPTLSRRRKPSQQRERHRKARPHKEHHRKQRHRKQRHRRSPAPSRQRHAKAPLPDGRAWATARRRRGPKRPPTSASSPANKAKTSPSKASRAGYTDMVVPFQLDSEVGILTFFSTTMVFGTPVDITLSELAIESFFPANAETGEKLRALVGDMS